MGQPYKTKKSINKQKHELEEVKREKNFTIEIYPYQIISNHVMS